MFVPIACNAKGIQIHHVRNNHWITSSSTAGCVEVFDSVYNNLSTDTEVQLATIYQNLAEKSVLQVKIVPCQRQTGSIIRNCMGFRVSQRKSTGTSDVWPGKLCELTFWIALQKERLSASHKLVVRSESAEMNQ